jgi:amino acid adenylation domain-containing protein
VLVLELVDSVASQSPSRLAARDADRSVTYGELVERAEQLARELAHRGVAPGDLVGLCVDRSVGLIVATLGIVKAGAAYVAMDPAYPDERLRWMLSDAHATAVVADARNAQRVGSAGDEPVVISGGGEVQRPAATDDVIPLPASPGAHDLAYVVYTSGSTGVPKGVLIEHESLINLVDWHRTAFELTPTDRCTQLSSPGFDAIVWEIWPALATGASLHVVPDDLRRDPIGLRDWLVSEKVTVSFVPTTVAEGLIGLSWPRDTPLRHLLTGGDALSRRPAPGLGFAVVNNYGLSETTVVATSGPVAADGHGAPTHGRPIEGVDVEILDQESRPVPDGAEGELVIAGVAVGRGYLNRPDLTAERFFVSGTVRKYRTGDRACILPDGEIEFRGRVDDQLSIRGFRIEPGEVAAALNSHPGIGASVVVGIGNSSSDRKLVAYAVPAGADQTPRTDLDIFMGGIVPEYMVPSTYVWLDELPLTGHGKIDRDALPTPVQAAEPSPAVPAPADATEAAVASIMAELLEVDALGADQNFFLLGGHSMLGAQLIVRLEAMFNAEISLRYLFDHPTPALIAAEVKRQLEGLSDTAVAG